MPTERELAAWKRKRRRITRESMTRLRARRAAARPEVLAAQIEAKLRAIGPTNRSKLSDRLSLTVAKFDEAVALLIERGVVRAVKYRPPSGPTGTRYELTQQEQKAG